MYSEKNVKVLIIVALVILTLGVAGIKTFSDKNTATSENTTSKEATTSKDVTINENTAVVKNVPMLIDLGAGTCIPCKKMLPVLIAILTFVSGKGNIALGIIMLFLYSIGHCTLILVSGTSVGFVEALSNSNKSIFIGKVLKIVLAIIVLILGLYLLYIGI